MTPPPFYLVWHKVPRQSVLHGSFNSRGPSESQPRVVISFMWVPYYFHLGQAGRRVLWGVVRVHIQCSSLLCLGITRAVLVPVQHVILLLPCKLKYFAMLQVLGFDLSPPFNNDHNPFQTYNCVRGGVICWGQQVSSVLFQKDCVPNYNPFVCVLFFSLTCPTAGSCHLKLPLWELSFLVVSHVTLFQT